jgi:hypothetical protein
MNCYSGFVIRIVELVLVSNRRLGILSLEMFPFGCSTAAKTLERRVQDPNPRA